MRKIETARELFRQYSEIFSCPVCKKRLEVTEPASLKCAKGHTFDLSRQGYANLLTGRQNRIYDRSLFESRMIICKSGFFSPMIREMALLLNTHGIGKLPGKTILADVGCGEGSHLHDILEHLKKEVATPVQGAGIDISKDGIHIAASEYEGIIWCVADLAGSPFVEGCFDALTCIFTPSNYAEFKRVLKEGGLLIKAVPGTRYLCELRSELFGGSAKQSYSNERVLDWFSDHFGVLEQKSVSYSVSLDNIKLKHLIKMTPLSWNAESARIEALEKRDCFNVTVEVEVLVGKNQ